MSEYYENSWSQYLLEDLPLQDYKGLYFQQDGAPNRNAQNTIIFLNITFGNKWMGIHESIRCAASPSRLFSGDFWKTSFTKKMAQQRARPNN